MTDNRFIRRGVRSDLEPKLGRAFLVSLGLHVVVFLLFSGIILPRFSGEKRPVYYVDLVNLPVEKPQAGRPDAAPKKTVKKKAEKRVAPVEKKSAPVVKVEKKTQPEKTVEKPAEAAEKPAPSVEETGPSEAEIASRIAAMQEKAEKRREIDELKNKLAALAAKDTRGEEAAPDVPVGSPEGTGDEVGTEKMAWLQAYLKQQWALSEYQVTRLDLEAEVLLEYNREGQLVDFRFLEKSGDPIFDDSVKAAILKSRQLEPPPSVHYGKVEVKFNLKDLLDR